MSINEGNQRIVYFARNPVLSENGVYVIMAGETLPSPEYRMERTERSGIFWGGVYVFEYYISGRSYIESGNKTYEVTAGDFVFMNARKKITYYSDKNDPCTKLWINFAGPLIRSVVDTLGLSSPVYLLQLDTAKELSELHTELAGITEETRADALDRVALHLVQLFLKINNTLIRTKKTERGRKLRTPEKIKEYIDSLSRPILHLDDLSERFSLSKTYIIHCFKRKYGISPQKYILQKKITEAQNMLTEKEMSIAETASYLDFGSTQHFSKAFKAQTGQSPAAYRAARESEWQKNKTSSDTQNREPASGPLQDPGK